MSYEGTRGGLERVASLLVLKAGTDLFYVYCNMHKQ